jgi:DNA-binding protein Fis
MLKNKIFTMVLMASIVLFSGCAPMASKEGSIAHNIPNLTTHQNSLTVSAHSGNDNITDEDLTKAIEQSIVENSLFTKVINGNGSDYLLEVAIVSMEKPYLGLDFTVNMEATWSLKDQANKIIMRKSIQSSHTATIGDALIGQIRLRLAMEGAIRENIRLGLLDISTLKLSK